MKTNFIDEEYLLLERPNLKEECGLVTEDDIYKYLIAYNTYSDLLIQFFIKKYYLLEVDKQLEKRSNSFKEVSSSDKDMYQHLAEGYLKYFYIRNNIHIERLSQDQLNYLFSVYQSNNFTLTPQNEQFINDTYLSVILENPKEQNVNINYGPDNLKFYKPSNAIIIGVRYDKFQNLPDDESALSLFSSAEGKLQILTDFLEYKIKHESNIPFYVVQYDEFSCKKKLQLSNKKR